MGGVKGEAQVFAEGEDSRVLCRSGGWTLACPFISDWAGTWRELGLKGTGGREEGEGRRAEDRKDAGRAGGRSELSWGFKYF